MGQLALGRLVLGERASVGLITFSILILGKLVYERAYLETRLLGELRSLLSAGVLSANRKGLVGLSLCVY